MDVIGIAHLERYVPHLEHYIRTTYKPGSLMLELEPCKKPEGSFGLLEEKLKDDWQIIHGDKYHDTGSRTGRFRERIRNIEKKVTGPNPAGFSSKTEAFSDFGYLLSSPFKQYLFWLMDAWNPKLISKRNEGFYETIDETSPDLSVVGAAHAFAIKRKKPYVNFKLFLVHSSIHYLSMPARGFFSLVYGSSPDELIWYPREINPAR